MLSVVLSARAQDNFPNRPVRLVNPYAPGGSVDLVSRGVATALSEIWKQQVIVDNRPGAGTVIGTELVVRAEPDGYTMLCNSSANEAVNRYLQTPQAKAYFGSYQQRPGGGSVAVFAEFHKSETERWSRIVAAAGIKPEGR